MSSCRVRSNSMYYLSSDIILNYSIDKWKYYRVYMSNILGMTFDDMIFNKKEFYHNFIDVNEERDIKINTIIDGL